MASGNVRWVPPLPQGWEAKYDPTQKRYFFIDHATKVTSWNDPRFSQPPAPVAPPVAQQQPQSQRLGYGHYSGFQQQQQQQQQQHQQQQQQARSSHQQPRSSNQQAEQIPMKSMVQDYITTRGGAQGSAQTSPQRLSLQQQQAKHHYVDDESDDESFDESSFLEALPDIEADDIIMTELRELFPSCPAGKIRMLLERNLNSKRNTELDIEAMGFEKTSPKPAARVEDATSNAHSAALLRISKLFPGAMGTIVQDIFNECNHDEAKTKANLRIMGYHESSGEQRRATPERHRDAADAERERKRTTSPNIPTSPKTKLTVVQKSRLVSKLCLEFPKLDRTIIQLALESAEDSEDKARRMLSFMYTDQPTSPKRTSPGKQAASSSTSPARSTGSSNYTQLNYNKVPTTSTNYTKPSSAERTRVTSPPRQSAADQQPKTSATAAKTKPAERTRVISAPRQGIADQQPQTSGTAAKTKQGTKVYVGKTRVVTSQQQVFRTERQLRSAPQQAFTSANRTPVMGPDPSLPTGADLSHVERYGAVTLGPNKDLVCGPNKSFVHGSQGAIGADPSLRRGPQAHLRCGPQPDLCRGPAYLASANKVLVTSI